jgi:hypothetical protein
MPPNRAALHGNNTFVSNDTSCIFAFASHPVIVSNLRVIEMEGIYQGLIHILWGFPRPLHFPFCVTSDRGAAHIKCLAVRHYAAMAAVGFHRLRAT